MQNGSKPWALNTGSAAISFSTIELKFVLRRNPQYYQFLLVFPVLLLEVLLLFVFFLPSGSNLKVSLAASLVLTMYVLQKDSASMIPSFNDNYPRILLGLSIGMLLGAVTLISSVISVTLCRLEIRSPEWLRRVFRVSPDPAPAPAPAAEGSNAKHVAANVSVSTSGNRHQYQHQQQKHQRSDSNFDCTSNVTTSDNNDFNFNDANTIIENLDNGNEKEKYIDLNIEEMPKDCRSLSRSTHQSQSISSSQRKLLSQPLLQSQPLTEVVLHLQQLENVVDQAVKDYRRRVRVETERKCDVQVWKRVEFVFTILVAAIYIITSAHYIRCFI